MRETSSAAILPHLAPACPYRRLLLFVLRRMAAGGINDAHAAHALLTGFGLAYRRPLVLLRAFMVEVARVSTTRLTLTHCCCPRMTDDEGMLVRIIANAIDYPDLIHSQLAARLHIPACLGALSSAQAVAGAFSDLGMPLGLQKPQAR